MLDNLALNKTRDGFEMQHLSKQIIGQFYLSLEYSVSSQVSQILRQICGVLTLIVEEFVDSSDSEEVSLQSHSRTIMNHTFLKVWMEKATLLLLRIRKIQQLSLTLHIYHKTERHWHNNLICFFSSITLLHSYCVSAEHP